MNVTRPKATTIGWLHDDVLVLIFGALAFLDPPKCIREEWVDPPHSAYELGWIKATHVCHLWRRILLSMSPLWASIVSELPHVYEVLLDRAKDAPLIINFLPSTGLREKHLSKMMTSTMNRYEYLSSLNYLAFLGSQQAQEFRDILSGGVYRQLKRLDISFYGTHPRTLDHLQDGMRLNAPNLEVAVLSGVRCTFMAPHLRMLELDRFGLYGRRDMDGFLRLLESSPLLEDLLFDVMHEPSDSEVSASGVAPRLVRLPRLQRLCIRSHRNAEALTHLFLGHLEFPTSCSLHLNHANYMHHVDGGQYLFGLFGHYFGQLPYGAVYFHAYSNNRGPELIQSFCINVFPAHDYSMAIGHLPTPHTRATCCPSLSLSRNRDFQQRPTLDADQVPTSGVRMALSSSRDQLFAEAIPYLRHDTITHLALDVDNVRHTSLEAIRATLHVFQAVEVIFVTGFNAVYGK
ncbi:unnamed protein product [Peniophora sp. CBMAI 1063]|nr:unnamed protein product [Peniophora sp. CBMAI 1063]